MTEVAERLAHLLQLVASRPLRFLIGVAIAIVALGLVVSLVRFLFLWIDRILESWKGSRLRGIRWQQQELLSEEDTTHL